MMYRTKVKILFRHCDPARIVFYPRYFEIINDVVEEFFAQIDGYHFDDMHPDAGVPMAQISSEFYKPSFHGDVLDVELGFVKIGGSSAHWELAMYCGEEKRIEAKGVMVYVENLRGHRWPSKVSDVLNEYVKENERVD